MRQPTPEEWERIETALGITDQASREELLARLKWVFSLQPGEIFGPNYIPETFTAEYRHAHAALKKQAEKVRSLLGDMDWRTAELETIITRIDDIAPDDDKGGRPADWRLRALIHKLGEIYSVWANRQPGRSHDVEGEPSGPFFRFVSECLRVFAPELHKEDQALDTAIKRALKMKVRPTV